MIEWKETKHGNSRPFYWAYIGRNSKFCLFYEGSCIYKLTAWFHAGGIHGKVEYNIERGALEDTKKEAKKIILNWADERIKELKDSKYLVN
jgi:hypothetical protein